jgi:peptidoglycan/xylan/chitin deacetylase (PgdA/CDA1 family)
MVRVRRDVLVLCYHGVAPGSRHGEVDPVAFRAQLGHLEDRGYRWVTFTDAVRGNDAGRVAAVTFDDGIASAVEFGLPVLRDVGAPGTMFPRLDLLGVPGRLGAEDLAGLADQGWEIGSHTLTHPVLTEVEDETLGVELAESRREIERLTGRACTSVAYPTGRADWRVAAAAAAAGYTAGAALEGAVDGPTGPLAFPRVGIRGDDSLRVFRVKCSRPVRRVRSSRFQAPVARVATGIGRARRSLR